MMHHSSDWEDDAVSTLYHVLYKHIQEYSDDRTLLFPFNVVLYEHHFPKVWLHIEDGTVTRKSGKDVADTSRLYNAFCSHLQGPTHYEDEMGNHVALEVHEVIAEFVAYTHEVPEMPNTPEGNAMSLAWSKHLEKDKGLTARVSEFADDRCSVAFFPPKLLNLFLRDRVYRPEKGALIQFMHPTRGQRNNIVQVSWFHSLDMVLRRSNIHNMNDTRYPLYQRYLADRTVLGHTEEQQCSASTRERLKSLTNRMALQIQQTYQGFDLHNLRLYFKLTKNDELCFLYCTYINMKKSRLGQTPVLERSSLNTQFTFYRNVMVPMYEMKSRSSTLSAHEKFLMERFKTLCGSVDNYKDLNECLPSPTGSSRDDNQSNDPQLDNNNNNTHRTNTSNTSHFTPSASFSRKPKLWLMQLKSHMESTRPNGQLTFSAPPVGAPLLRDRSRVVRSVNDHRGVPSCYRGNEELTPSWLPKKIELSYGCDSKATFTLRK